MTNQDLANGISKRLQAAEKQIAKVYEDAIEALDDRGATPETVVAAEQAIEMVDLSIDLAHRLLGNAANTVPDVTVQSGGQDKDPPGGGGN